MKKILCAFLSAAILALSAVPALAVETAESGSQTPVLEDGTYVPNQVIVLFKDSAVDTETAISKDGSEELGADFGELSEATNSEDEALGAADDELKILNISLGDDFTLEDTVVFGEDEIAESKGGDAVGASIASADDFTVALVSSEKYDTATLIEKLSKNKNVAIVEPNYYTEYNSCDYSLNDPMNWYNYQANSPLDNNTGGDSVNDRGFDLENYLSTNAGHAWSKLSGEEDEVVIAVIDSGIIEDHEDLENMLWTNPDDIGLEGEHGFNFYDNTTDITDDIGHGTHCSGIIAAQANNEIGIAGTGSMANIKIMMLATASSPEYKGGDDSNCSYREIGAFNYALKAKQRGVNIVATSCSWGSPGESWIFDAITDRLGEEGIVGFYASGNDNKDIDYIPQVPAAGNSAYKVSVGAANIDGSRACFSNYGKSKVDIFAPGVNVLSTVGYKTYFPNTYSKEKRSETTSYYGVFNGNAQIENGSATPYLADCDDTVKQFGASVFTVQNEAGEVVTDSPAQCEFTLDREHIFTKSDDPASLKVTIKNTVPGERYYLYFPFEKDSEVTGKENSDYSLLLMRENDESSLSAAVSTGEIIVEENGSCSMKNGGGNRAMIDDAHVGLYTHATNRFSDAGIVSAKELGDRNIGIGVCVYPNGSGDQAKPVSFYIDSIAVQKADADLPVFESYDIMSGTSMATPAAAGAYAVVASLYPQQEGQSGSEYALENRARFLSYATKTDELSDLCTTGGYIDLSRVGEIDPVLTRAVCDLENGDIILSGQNLNPDYTLYYQRRAFEGYEPVAFPCEGMTAEFSDDGNTITIHNASALFNTYTEFSLRDGENTVAKICEFLVKGEKSFDKIYSEPYTETISNQYFILPHRQIITDTKGENLYGYETNTGVISRYDGTRFNNIIGTNLEDAVRKYLIEEENCNQYEALHDYKTTLEKVENAVYMNNKLYQFFSINYSPSADSYISSTSFYIGSIDYTAENPKWSIKQINSFDVAFHCQETRLNNMIAMDGKIYYIGYIRPKDGEGFEKAMFSYDPDKNIWTKEEAMPVCLRNTMITSYDGKIYVALGLIDFSYYTVNAQEISNAIYCFDGESWSTLTDDIPYINDKLKVDLMATNPLVIGTMIALKDGLMFINCSIDGGGNVSLYRYDTGEFEPLNYTFSGFKADMKQMYSAVETEKGIYYFEECTDGYLRQYEMYLLPVQNGDYTPSYPKIIKGDVNGDGVVDILDSALIQKYAAKKIELDEQQLAAADVNGDGSVDILDATIVQKYAVGKINKL